MTGSEGSRVRDGDGGGGGAGAVFDAYVIPVLRGMTEWRTRTRE